MINLNKLQWLLFRLNHTKERLSQAETYKERAHHRQTLMNLKEERKALLKNITFTQSPIAFIYSQHPFRGWGQMKAA